MKSDALLAVMQLAESISDQQGALLCFPNEFLNVAAVWPLPAPTGGARGCLSRDLGILADDVLRPVCRCSEHEYRLTGCPSKAHHQSASQVRFSIDAGVQWLAVGTTGRAGQHITRDNKGSRPILTTCSVPSHTWVKAISGADVTSSTKGVMSSVTPIDVFISKPSSRRGKKKSLATCTHWKDN